MCENFIPLLEGAQHPRIVNVSSTIGSLDKHATGTFDSQLLLGCTFFASYTSSKGRSYKQISPTDSTSKTAENAIALIFARKYPKIRVTMVCPGYNVGRSSHLEQCLGRADF